MDGPERSPIDVTAPVAKPPEVVALGPVSADLFVMMKRSFQVGEALTLDLSAISTPRICSELTDRIHKAGMAMRKLQALHYTAQQGTETRPSIVLGLIISLLPTLVEVPKAQLNGEVATGDWDQEWQELEAGLSWRPAPGPWTPAELGPALEALHLAVRALHVHLRNGDPVIA